jgi:hypothetical protein
MIARLEFWVPGPITNGLNAREHWAARYRRSRFEREKVRALTLVALQRRTMAPGPKLIELAAYVGLRFDDDGLVAACKHLRDGLIGAGLIESDAPSAGHTFAYSQTPGTPVERRGVRVTLTTRGALPHGG